LVLLRRNIRVSVSVVDADNLKRIKLYDYNTLILPDGYYDFSEEQQNKLGVGK
jgi:hypothetical protein